MNEPETLREHDITLRGPRVVLRPMRETDWPALLGWNSDPDVLYYSEGDDVSSRTLDEIQPSYRAISRQAFCFIIEHEHAPIGECWLQRMNLPRILERYPGRDCRRIDLTIGEKPLWGQGLGIEVIALLTRFGFERQGADLIFGCDIADYNPRSLQAFRKAGFTHHATIAQPPRAKARHCHDLVLNRADFPFAERGR